MRLTFLKVSAEKTDSGFLINVAPGALRFATKSGEVALAESLQIEMDGKGQFTNILREVAFEVFEGQSLTGQIMQGSVFSVVMHEDFETMLYKAMRECKVIPFMRMVDERQLYASEYERVLREMVGQ